MTARANAAPWGRLAAVLVVVLVVDQITKALAVGAIEPGERVEVLPFLDLVYVRNEGVAFGFLGDASRGVVLAVTALALVLVAAWFATDPQRRWGWFSIGLLAGGAVGNLIDRLARDAVVDFIDFPAWPSFNVADIAITAGAITLALSVLFEPDSEPEPEPER